MKLIETEIKDVFIIENFYAQDNRGSFTKTYHEEFFLKNNLCTNFKESFFSVSQKDVIRGMHFQLPPYDHEKLVYVVQGEVKDVIFDLRKTSKTYGSSIEVILSNKNHKSVYIPKGMAHGFKANQDDTIMVYNATTVFNKDYDSGFRYDSFGFDWKVQEPVLSKRDLSLTAYNDFKKMNPFV